MGALALDERILETARLEVLGGVAEPRRESMACSALFFVTLFVVLRGAM